MKWKMNNLFQKSMLSLPVNRNISPLGLDSGLDLDADPR